MLWRIVSIVTCLACVFIIAWLIVSRHTAYSTDPLRHNVDELESSDDFTRTFNEICLGLDEIFGDGSEE